MNHHSNSDLGRETQQVSSLHPWAPTYTQLEPWREEVQMRGGGKRMLMNKPVSQKDAITAKMKFSLK